MAKKKDTELSVLPNQIKARIINQVDKNAWVHLHGNWFNIPLTQFTEHPQNSSIYKTVKKDDDELRLNIENVGILTPVIATLIADADGTLELRILSGHRRIQMALETGKQNFVMCEVLEAMGDEEELLLLFSCNVGRGMQTSAKIRFFEGLMQFLCQDVQSADVNSICDAEMDEMSPFVLAVKKRGIEMNGKRLREVITQVTGFSNYEVDLLTQVCSLSYRENVLNRIRAFKNGGKKIAENYEKQLIALRKSVMDGETSLAEAGAEISRINKEISAAEKGKSPKLPKTVKTKPDKKEQVVQNKSVEEEISEYVEGFSPQYFNQWGVEINDVNKDDFYSCLKEFLCDCPSLVKAK